MTNKPLTQRRVLELFYMIGSIAMFGASIGQILNLKALWDTLTFGAKLSSACNIIFNLALVLFFLWLYKDLDKTMPKDLPQIDDLKAEELAKKYRSKK